MEVDSPPQITDMPNELMEKIFKDAKLNDKLNTRATCSWFAKYWRERIPELVKPDACNITAMFLSQARYCYLLKNSLHVRICIEDVSTAQHFLQLGRHCDHTWKRKDKKTRNVECFFSIPIGGPQDFALLEEAHIDHFYIDKRIPFYLTTNSIAWLKTMLRGCKIEQLSFVLDAGSVALLKEVSEIVAMVQAKHIEFVVQSVFKVSKFSLARNISINVAKLVEAGVKEVTLTDDDVNGRQKSYGDNISKDLTVDYPVIFALLKGGILHVTFNAEFADKKGIDPPSARLLTRQVVRDRSYRRFLKKLIRLGQDVSVKFKARSLPLCADGETFQATNNHPIYVTHVTPNPNNTARCKGELHITQLRSP